MIELKVRLGPKGQLVIPKIFRNLFKLSPGEEVIITIEKGKGVLIRNTTENIADKFKTLATKTHKELGPKKIKKIIDKHYEDKYSKWIKT